MSKRTKQRANPLRKRIVRTCTLIRFCMDHHSGQFSRGYSLLCRLQKRLQRLCGITAAHFFYLNLEKMLSENFDPSFHRSLVERYGEKV